MSLLVDLHTSGKRLNAGATINNAGIGVLPIWRENGFYLQIFSKLSMSYTGGRVVLLGGGGRHKKPGAVAGLEFSVRAYFFQRQ